MTSQEILKICDVQKKIVAQILFFKIRPSQEILKIRDGTPLEAEELLTYIKSPRNGLVWHFSSKLDVPSNVIQKKRVARILFFKIRTSQEILKIRDGTPLEAEEILTYIKMSSKRIGLILFFKIRPSQEILKIRDGTPLEAEELLTYIKSPRNGLVWHFSSKLDVPKIPKIRDGTLHKKRVAQILFFKIRQSQEILKIRDGTPLEAEELLTYIKSPRNGLVWHFSSKLDVPSNVLQKKIVAWILFFKIKPSQEIPKIRDGTRLEAEEILTYIKRPSKQISLWPSQEILKIRDGTPLEKRVAQILFFKIRTSQEILKIRDGTPLEAEELLTYIKSPRNGLVWHFSSKLDVPSNLLQKKIVAWILFFKIKPSQEIPEIRDGTRLEAEEILTYIKRPSKQISLMPSQEILKIRDVQKKIVARILLFKIMTSQEILKICDGTPLELDVLSNVVQKKIVARILFFKIRPSQEILKIRDGTPLEAEEILTYIKELSKRSVWYFSSKLDVPSNMVQKKRVVRILFFKIRPSQEILKIRDGTPLEAEELLTYIKSPRNGLVWHFSSKLDVPSNVIQKKRVARILFFKIRTSQEILKIRDGTPLEAEEILTYIKMSSKRIGLILFFKIRPSQEILKIRDGTPLEAEELLTYIKSPRNGLVWHFSSKLDVPSNVLQKKIVAWILFFKIKPSQEIPKIRDGTRLEAEEILTYIKRPSKQISLMPSQEILKIRDVHKKRVAQILFFKIRPSQEILKIRDGTPLEAEELLTYIKSPRNGLVWHFSSKLDVPSNVLQKKIVAWILFFKIKPSQEIPKIRDGTRLEAEEILTYIKRPSKQINKLDVPNNIVQKKRVAPILFFKIRTSEEILKIRDGTPLEAEELLTYIKSPRNGLVWHFSSKLDVPSNVLQKKIVAWILFFKIKPSQEIPKIRDGTRLEAEEILTYIKRPSKQIKPSQEILKIRDGTPLEKRVAQILFFKIRTSQEILKIRDGTPLEAEELLTYIKSPRNGLVWHFSSKLDVPSNLLQKKIVAWILFFKIKPSQEIPEIRDGTRLEAEEILTYIKRPSKQISLKKIVARILLFKIMTSQEILKICDGTPLELDVLSNVVQKKIVARILFFKIRPSQEILKIRDGTPLEAEEILTYIKELSKRSVWYFSSKLDVPSNMVQKKRVVRILFFKIRPSQEILKIRDGTPLEAEELLTYIKSPRNGLVWHFSSKLDVPSNVIQKKRVARILFFKIRTSQEILKIRDGTPLEAEEILTYIKMSSKRIGLILFFKIRPSQEILKIRDGTPLEAEELLTYIKSPRNGLVWHFSSKLDVPSNVLQKKIVAWILFFKIKPSQEIPKIRDGTRLEAEEILTYIKRPSKQISLKRVAQILFFKIRPSQEILKIRDGTPLEAEELLTYIKSPRNGLVWHFSSKLDVPSNVLQKKIVAWILFFKIKPSQEIPKIRDGTRLEAEEILTYIKRPSKQIIRDGTPLELDVPNNIVQKKRVAPILFFKIRTSEEILKIRDGTPLEAEELLTYIKSPRNGLVWHFSSKLDVPSNVLQKKIVAWILFFKIKPSQEIPKIRDGTRLEAEEILTYIKRPSKQISLMPSQEIIKICDVHKKRVAQILFFKIRPSQEILKIRDGTPLEAEELLTYIKSPRNGLVWHFSSKLDVPSNVLQKKIVAWILFFKIKPSQEIPKIRDGTRLELDVPNNIVQKKRVAPILFFKIRTSEEILKIRDGTPLEAEELLTYIKSPRNGLVWHFSSKLDVPSNVLQKKIVAWILFFKIKPSQEIPKIRDGTRLEAEEILTYIKRPSKQISLRSSQEILKIRDGTPLEAEEILTYIKIPRNGLVWHFSSKLDVPNNIVQKKRVAPILFFKIRTSQEILKIRDGTLLEAEELLTYIKSPRNGLVWHFSSKLDVPSNVLQKKIVAWILFFKIKPSQEIPKIRDGTRLEAEEILTYIKRPSKQISLLDVPSNVVQKKIVAWILFFKIRPSQEIIKICDGTPLEAEEILTYTKKPSKRIEILKIRDGTPLELDVSNNVVHKKRVAQILFFKIRPSQEILKIRDGTPLEAEELLTYIKIPRNGLVWHFSSKLDVPSNVLQKKIVAWILFFKIKPSQEIPKIRDGTRLEAEELLTYTKKPSKWIVKKIVARILFFKIRPSQEILKIRDGTPLEAEEILTYIKELSKRSVWPSQEILKIRDGTPLEAEELLTYIKSPRNGLVWHFSSKLDVPSNVIQKKRVARILFFKIRTSQEILKIRDGTPLEAEEILTYIKMSSKRIGLILIFKIRPSQEILKIRDVHKKRVAQILFFKIRPSQEILKIRDGTPLEAEELLTYIKSPRNGLVWHFSSKLDVPSNVLQKRIVAWILFFKIKPSQEIPKIRDGTRLEAEEILTYIKRPSKQISLMPSQEILKIRDGTPLELDVSNNVVHKKRVAQILFFKIRPSQEILKIRDGTPLEAEELLTYIKSPRNGLVWHFSSKLDVPSNVLQKKIVAWILFFKIKPSQEIPKIRDGTRLEAEELLTYTKKPSKWIVKKIVARILFFKIRPSQEILKIRDGTPLEAEEILTYIKELSKRSVWPSQEILKIRDGTPLEAEELLTYIKSPRNGLVWHFSSKLDVPSNVIQKKRVARILFFKIRTSQEILKIRDGTPLEAEEILTYIKMSSPSQEILKIRDGTPLEKKIVAWILFFKIKPSQEIPKIRDGTRLELDVLSNVVQKKIVARILFFKIRPSQEILKIRDGTPLEAEEILTYIKELSKRSVWYFSSKPSQEILKIRDGTPLEAEELLTYIKSPRNGLVWHFSSKLDVPSNVIQKKRVARILFFKIRTSQEILKIRDGTPLEAEEILTYIKMSSKRIGLILIFKIRPSQEILKIRDGTPLEKRVAQILFFKIRPSQEILKIRDGTPLEAEELLTYIKSPRNGLVWHFSSKLDVPSNVLQKRIVAWILFFKIKPSQEIPKIRDGTRLEAEEILTYIKRPSKQISLVLF
ncbi:hypothetical protein OROHE_018166 [Orobanche hederae]